jgi:hypothetical protein
MARNRLATENELEFGGDEFFQPTDLSFVAPVVPVAATPAPVVPAPAPAFSLPAGWEASYIDTFRMPGSEEIIQQETKPYEFGIRDEDILRSLGFQGPTIGETIEGYGEYATPKQSLTPEAQAFLQQGGYKLASRRGQGGDWFTAVDPTGKPVGEAVFRKDEFDPLWNLVTGVLSAAAGNVAAAGLAGAGMPSALARGVTSYIGTGGNEQAALGAGIGSLATPYIGGAAKAASEAVGGGTLGDIAGRAVTGAGTSALGAAVRGGDIGEALLSGALGGGTGAAVNATTAGVLDQLDLPAPVERVVGTALTNALLGRDVEKAVTNALFGEIVTAGKEAAAQEKLLETAYGPKSGWSQDTPKNQEMYREIWFDEAPAPAPAPVPESAPVTPIPVSSLVDEILAAPTVESISDEELLSYILPDYVFEQPAPVTELAPFEVTATRPEEALPEEFVPVTMPEEEPAPVTQLAPQEITAARPEEALPEEFIPVTMPEEERRVNVTEGTPAQVEIIAPRVEPAPIPSVLDIEDILRTPIPQEDLGDLTKPVLGYMEEDRTPVAPSPAPSPAPAPAPAPSPAPAPAAKPKNDLDALLLALAMMQQRQPEADEYRVAQILARSPFGSILDETGRGGLPSILRG